MMKGSVNRLSTLLLAMAVCTGVHAQSLVTVASTTSTENSGLFAHLLPLFEAETGLSVRVIAQGTGQALETARRGDADVVLVHARAQEDRFVEEGYGVERFDLMYNDFILVGPADDPAAVASASTAAEAMLAIATEGFAFASRGDESGTHRAEQRLWDQASLQPTGSWYLETGSGMGATLNTAAQIPAYTLTDRGTWLSFRNRADLVVLFEGDPALFNAYGVILVNPARHPHVHHEAGQTFIDWLVSEQGQAAIAAFKIDGEQLFYPSAQ